MATTGVTTGDLADEIARILATIPDLRVYAWVADTFRPPGVVIGQPDIDYADTGSGFCKASWQFPLTIVASRNQDRDAQRKLADIVTAIVTAIADVELNDSVILSNTFSIEPLTAVPITATVAGQDLPGYLLRVEIRA